MGSPSFVHSHSHLAISGECFTHSLHSREYIHSIHANSGHYQKFRKGVGGQRGLSRRNPSYFLYPFSYAPLGKGGHISGELYWAVFGVCLSPTPSSQRLFETSDTKNMTATWDSARNIHSPDPWRLERSSCRTFLGRIGGSAKGSGTH